MGKRTPLEEYNARSRGSLGVATINKHKLNKLGKIAAARVVQEDDHLTIMSAGGVIIRTKVSQISQASRVTQGVHLMNLQDGDSVVTVARIAARDLKTLEEESGENNSPVETNNVDSEYPMVVTDLENGDGKV